ncbi:MAG: carboxypeptidase-like regulatory domain-containing protein [Flavobacteriales bacterium]
MSFGAVAQVGQGTLKGRVTDFDSKDALPFASVVLFLNGNQVAGTNTDFDGEYTIKPIQPGTYDVLFSFVGYQSKKVTGVKITANKIQFVNSELGAGVMMEEAEVVEYSVPLIDKDGGASGTSLFTIDLHSNATGELNIPDEGVRFGTDIYAVLTNVTSVTAFFK